MTINKNIEIFSYDPKWPELFANESNILKSLLRSNCISIFHIGSTSVPNLTAKNAIDILLIINNLKISLLLENHDYEFRGEYNIPLRYFFRKRSTSLKINLHVVEPGHGFIMSNLCFRDYLRNDSKAREEYTNLKKELLNSSPSYLKIGSEFSSYNSGKNFFIKNILKKAAFNDLNVNICIHKEEWQEYHRIKEQQIFTPKKIIYNRDHPSIFNKNHFHCILYKGIDIVTISHIELLSNTTVILRSIATGKPFEKQNYATSMLNFIEKWLKAKGVQKIKLLSTQQMEKFFRKFGYINITLNKEQKLNGYTILEKAL